MKRQGPHELPPNATLQRNSRGVVRSLDSTYLTITEVVGYSKYFSTFWLYFFLYENNLDNWE